MERKAEHDIARKLKVLSHAKEHGNISKHVVISVFAEKPSTHGDALMNLG